MRTARPTRRQIEAAADGLDYDALAVDACVLADSGYEVFGLPEFDFETRSLVEFESELEQVEAELLAHEVRAVSGGATEMAAVVRLRVGEIHTVRGWAA
ncbi:hypothetical protein [Amycolatopsis lurida]|uniref:hypothetical protein n=1 Tax=Amycolatopsis lurida TaxID=31959 RepID=UPI003657B7B1